ncbi:MAG: hypothetical protein AAFN92_11370 [Bacteroidota bacterium]
MLVPLLFGSYLAPAAAPVSFKCLFPIMPSNTKEIALEAALNGFPESDTHDKCDGDDY